jgi:hypothetical protein
MCRRNDGINGVIGLGPIPRRLKLSGRIEAHTLCSEKNGQRFLLLSPSKKNVILEILGQIIKEVK